ncbi:MAG: diaminopimelate epimerase [Zetaproteobacteria bacterium]|nr:diaminopimelate epimerase [Zetaproteobacteria bacterium]
MIFKFQKWHGCTNDFILGKVPYASWDTWKDSMQQCTSQICSRSGNGIGADGILLYTQKPDAPETSFEALILNSDGSIAQNCGNGLRCLAAHLFADDPRLLNKMLGRDQNTISIHTAGIERICSLYRSDREQDHIQIMMGHLGNSSQDQEILQLVNTQMPDTAPQALATHLGWLGNPHLVLEYSTDTPLHQLIHTIGPRLQEGLPIDGVNVHLVIRHEESIQNPEYFEMVSWERGAGFTQACGSGASVTAALLTDFTFHDPETPILVHMPGGKVEIYIDEPDGPILLRGPATKVFEGQINI